MENVVLNVKSPAGETVRFLYRRGKSAHFVLEKTMTYFDIAWPCVLVMEDKPTVPIDPDNAIPVSDIHSEHNLEILISAPE